MGDRPVSLRESLSERSIALGEQHEDRDATVRRTGELLAAGGSVDPAYTDEMLAALEQYGPYIVIAPGVALAHSRPSAAVRGVAFSILTLDPAIEFGHAENDPVSLVVGMAAPDAESHIEALRQMAELLGDATARERLAGARSPSDVLELVEGASG